MPLTFSDELVNGPIAATLTTLTRRYPISETWLLGARIDSQTPAPVTVPAERTILIPPNLQEEMETDVKNGLSQITAHEFAHALLLASQLEASDGDFGRLPAYELADLLRYRSLSPAERSAHLYKPANPIGHIVRSARKEGLSEDGFGSALIHSYGASDDMEFFAEVMRAHWVREEHDEPIAPIIGRIAAQVDDLYLA